MLLRYFSFHLLWLQLVSSYLYKAIREKMVRFILDADEWIQSQKNEGPVTRKWNQDDYIFYQSILTHSEYCNNALIGSIGESKF